MAFYHSPEFGTYHLNEAKPPRIVPGNERHKWASKPAWGEQTTCVKCGCVKRRKKTQPDYTETYQMPGGVEVSERPACTGKYMTMAIDYQHESYVDPYPGSVQDN